MFTQHVPDDWDIGAEDATKRLEDRVRAEGNVVPCEVWTTATKDYGKAYGGYDACAMQKVSPLAFLDAEKYNLRKTEAEDQADNKLLLCLQLQVPYHRNRHQEDPDIGDQVRNVGEVREGDHRQTIAFYCDVPICFQWPASKKQRDSNADAPCYYKKCGREDRCAEDRMDKNAPVKGKDTELDEDEREVVEMAEDVVALAHHHLVIVRHNNNMSAHAMWGP
jgi:hypothetical protein